MNYSKKRVLNVLNYEIPDRLPVHDNFWPEIEEIYRERLNLKPDILLEDYFDLDVMILGPDESPFLSKIKIIKDDDDETIQIDGWGRKVRTVKNGYFLETERIHHASFGIAHMRVLFEERDAFDVHFYRDNAHNLD